MAASQLVDCLLPLLQCAHAPTDLDQDQIDYALEVVRDAVEDGEAVDTSAVMELLQSFLPPLEQAEESFQERLATAVQLCFDGAGDRARDGPKKLEAPVSLVRDAAVSAKGQKKSRGSGGTSKKRKKREKMRKRIEETTAKNKEETGDGNGSSSDSSDDDEGDAPISAIAALRRKRRVQQMSVSRHHGQGRHFGLYDEMERRRELVDEEALQEQVITAPTRFERDHKGLNRHIHVSDLTMAFGERTLLDHAELILSPSHRYGLVGKNGSGKTTLLDRINRGLVQNFPSHMSTLLVRQEVVGDDSSALQAVQEGNAELVQYKAEEKLLLEMSDQGITYDEDCGMRVDEMLNEVYERLGELDADADKARASAILSGLGFSEEMKEMPTKRLSGGWRMRVALAQALLTEPDVLMLDEPTNHLDLRAVLWLQHYLNNVLANEKTIVIIVSHDRTFLDQVCTDTIILANKTLYYQPMKFSEYLVKAANQQAHMENEAERQDKQKKQLEQQIRSMKAHAKKHKLGDKGTALSQAASRQKAMNRVGMQKTVDGKKWKISYIGDRIQIKMPKPSKPLHFAFPEPAPLRHDGHLVEMEKCSFSYDGKSDLFSDLTLNVSMGSRIVLLGRNGSGKTTLVKTLDRHLQATGGEVRHHPELRMAHFAQHHVDSLDMELTAVEHLHKHHRAGPNGEVEVNELHLRKHLGSFGISGKTAVMKMTMLSGGQKSRVVLATVMWNTPNLLILDEPTNHLDFESINAIEEALSDYKGGVVLVSHDQHLVSTLAAASTHAAQLLVVGRGRVRDITARGYAAYVDALSRAMSK